MPRTKIQAVLFDLDGVIVFTDKYHYRAWKRLADDEGWAFDEEVNHLCRGVARMQSLQAILDHNGLDLPEAEKLELAERKNALYVELLGGIDAGDVYPGSVEFARALRARGVRLALCSASKNAALVLDRLGLAELFEVVITGHDVRRGKPDPEIFETAARRLGVHPAHCVVFEDAESGVAAAHAAGMKCIGVGPAERLSQARETIESYNEIDVEALIHAGHKRVPEPEPWGVTQTAFEPSRQGYWESVFALTNGCMGLRGTDEEQDKAFTPHGNPGLYVNALYERQRNREWLPYPSHPKYGHAIVNVCDARAITVEIEGERLRLERANVSHYRRRLDLRAGRLVRQLVWESPSGRRVRIESERLASMTRRHSAAIRYRVTPLNFSGPVTLISSLRGALPSNVMDGVPMRVERLDAEAGRFAMLQRTEHSGLVAGVAVGHRLDDAASAPEIDRAPDGVTARWTLEARQDEALTLEKHLCVYSSVETPEGDDPLARADAALDADFADGYDTLAAEQAAFWAAHWADGDVEIDGPADDQQALRFNLFHLRQSHPEADRLSISATGQTSDGYNGHIFWDTEMYMAPYFNYLDPALVRSLLMYRHSILDRARERARQMDGPGALYAWNSITGEECGVVFEASTAQYHLNPDVAYAIRRYWLTTGDRAFLFGPGAEMLCETARFMADLGSFVEARGGEFCIDVVCGPDEYGCAADNNAYTNAMTRLHLEFAAETWQRMRDEAPERFDELRRTLDLDDDEVALWRRAAERMRIPFNDELGIHEQDDRFLTCKRVDMATVPFYSDIRWGMHPLNLWRQAVIKQADVVLAMLTLGHRFTPEVKRANYEYYEPLTNHGSSLSPAIHAIIAAEIGRADDAYAYWREAAFMDLFDGKNNTRHGVHSACLGGVWMTAAMGFAGLRDDSGRLELASRLPEAWDALRFRLVWRGRRLEIAVGRDGMRLDLLEGEAMTLLCDGREVCLTAEGCDVPRASGG